MQGARALLDVNEHGCMAVHILNQRLIAYWQLSLWIQSSSGYYISFAPVCFLSSHYLSLKLFLKKRGLEYIRSFFFFLS